MTDKTDMKKTLPTLKKLSEKEVKKRFKPFLKWLEKPEIKSVLKRMANK